MRKRVYIAGPISKGILLDNIEQADEAMCELMKLGYAPMNPMLSCFAGGVDVLFRMTDGGAVPVTGAVANSKANNKFQQFTHQDWLDMDFAWVAVSDAVLRLPGDSKGADMEVEFATKNGVPVFYSIEGLTAHFQGGDK